MRWGSDVSDPRARPLHDVDVLEFGRLGFALCSCGWIHDEPEESDQAMERAEAHAAAHGPREELRQVAPSDDSEPEAVRAALRRAAAEITELRETVEARDRTIATQADRIARLQARLARRPPEPRRRRRSSSGPQNPLPPATE